MTSLESILKGTLKEQVTETCDGHWALQDRWNWVSETWAARESVPRNPDKSGESEDRSNVAIECISLAISGTDGLEVPTIIYKAIRPILQGYAKEYPHNTYGQTYGTFTYLHLLDPEILIEKKGH